MTAVNSRKALSAGYRTALFDLRAVRFDKSDACGCALVAGIAGEQRGQTTTDLPEKSALSLKFSAFRNRLSVIRIARWRGGTAYSQQAHRKCKSYSVKTSSNEMRLPHSCAYSAAFSYSQSSRSYRNAFCPSLSESQLPAPSAW